MKPWLRRLALVFYPNRCCICGEVIRDDEHLCARCQREAPFILPPICEICGRSEDDCICGKHRRTYERCVSPFYYSGKLGHTGIAQVKEHGYRTAVEGYAIEMAEMVRREYGGIPFDLITEVPQYPKDMRRRGYNPALLLAAALSERTGIPYLPVLVKLCHTAPQKEMTAAGRQGNLLGVFDVPEPDTVTGKTVLLVDDVITTGATLDECAKMLKIAGAKEVYGITAAAALLKKPDNSV